MTNRFKLLLIIFFINLPTFGLSQVIDSVVVRVIKTKPYSEPWRIGAVDADSLSSGMVIYHSGTELFSEGWPAGMLQYTYDSTGKIIEETCPNVAVPQAHHLFSYNAIADTIIRQNFIAGSWVNDSLQIYWHNGAGLDTVIVTYSWETASWVNAFRYDQLFDTSGIMINQIKYSWNSTGQNWDNQQQIFWQGDTTIIRQLWDGSNWINNWKKTMSIFYSNDWIWSPSGNTWDIVTNRSYTYNINNQIISEHINNYPGNTDVNYSYDAGGNLIERYSSSLSMGGYPSASQTLFFRFTVPSSSSFFVVSSDYSICSADTVYMNPLVLGGTQPYHYNWFPATGLSSDTIPDPFITSDTTSEFDLTVTDSLGVIAICTVDVEVTRSVDVHLSVSSVDTSSNCNSAVLVATSSDHAYYYWFFNGQVIPSTSNPLHISQNGIYSVEAHSSGLCTSTTFININFLPHTAATAIILPDSCKQLLIAACPSCVSFQWFKSGVTISGANNDTLVVGLTGSYSIHTVDSNQCQNTTLPLQFYPFRASEYRHVNNPCYGDCNGQLGIAGSNGHVPYNYFWSTADTVEYLDSLCTGVYTITITDALGCVVNSSDTITSPVTPLSLNHIVDPAIIPDSCSGRIIIVPSGEYENNLYAISVEGSNNYFGNAGDTFTFNNMCSGWNNILINNYACTRTDSIYVNLSPGCAISAQGTDPLCHGSCDGNLACTAGGTPPFQYDWSSGDSSVFVSNLCSGYYSVILIDSFGCKDTSLVTLNDPALLQIFTSTQATTCIGCSDGMITVVYSGGSSPFYINLVPSLGTLINDTIFNLPAGIYSVCITDSFGCSTCQSDTVQDDPLSVNGINKIHDLLIYPNPCREQVFMQSMNWTLGDVLDILDLSGKIIETINLTSPSITFYPNSLGAGIYFCKLRKSMKRQLLVILD